MTSTVDGSCNMALIYRRNKSKVLFLTLLLLGICFFCWKKNFLPWSIKHAEAVVSSEPVKHNFQPPPVIAQPRESVQKNSSSFGRIYTLEEMKQQAVYLNFVQKIKNIETYGDHRADDPVIVVQVHDRPDLLKKLLDSLRSVRGIDSATLIISRDKFTPEMDQVVDKDINFCRYMEIFFPFSMQLYPDKFPGEDPNDCPRDLSKSSAKEKGCNNAEYPDMYGHYREVKYVQIKHHWFWKLNMVFSGLREIQDNTGPILLLEDDNYVAPDLIDIMRKAVLLRDASCPHCLAMTLGAYDFSTDYKTRGSYADVIAWLSSKHNIGMVVTKAFYDKVTNCMEYFCTYDDYNWDWSLQSAGLKCIPEHLFTLVLKVPRVYHLGCTGFHQKEHGVCNIDEEARKLKSLFETQADYLFPSSLKIEANNVAPNSPHVQNGGWGDIRDHTLCQRYKELSKSLSSIK